MAYYDLCWYCNAGNQSTTGYYAVPQRAASTAVVAGQLCRQFTAPAVGSERVFVCIIAGAASSSTDATWVLTRGAKTVDGTATWMECTGIAALNSDIANTVNWTAAKAIGTPSLGTVIQRNNGASYQICTTAGTLGTSEPAFSDTAGVTTTETSATTVWTSLGVVGNWTAKGAAPHARLANACASTWFAAGNAIYVGDNHAESQATAITIAPASVGSIGRVICHNHSGSYPPAPTDLQTTATVSTTAGASITFSPGGGAQFYVYGLIFKAGVGVATLANLIIAPTVSWLYLDNCSLQLATTFSGSALIQISGTSSFALTLNNVTVSFGGLAQNIDINIVDFNWKNTGPILVSGSVVPNVLLNASTAGRYNTIVLEALDLGQLTDALTGSGAFMGNLLIKDCKLNASMTIPIPPSFGQTVQLVRSDSGATAYKSARYTYEGTETTETSITRVGGAADPTGQQQSRKIVTTANSQWLRPFKAEPYAIWNAVTAANVTVTVCGTINSGTLPNNDDIWMDVEYLGSALFPIGTIVNTTKSNLYAANAVVASDGSTWNGGGSGAGWSSFRLTTTLSSPQPGMAGYIHVRVRAAKPSMTFYIDPQIGLS